MRTSEIFYSLQTILLFEDLVAKLINEDYFDQLKEAEIK